MAISLYSFSPNTKAESTKVNSNFTAVKNAILDAAHRAFPWLLLGTVTVANGQGGKFLVPQGVTAVTVWGKLDAGTCTIDINADASKVVASFDITAAAGSSTTFDTAGITAGQVLTLDVTAASGTASNLMVTLDTQVTTVV